MKKSRQITLTVMTTLFVAGCEQPNLVRNVYGAKQDCVADYSERQCEEQRSYGGSGGFTGRYLGPPYDADKKTQAPGSGREGKAVGRINVARGGFGSTGRAFSFRGG